MQRRSRRSCCCGFVIWWFLWNQRYICSPVMEATTRRLSLKANEVSSWTPDSLFQEKDGVRRSAWPMLPCLLAVLFLALLGMHIWPSGRSLLWGDPLRAWDPHVKVGNPTKGSSAFKTLFSFCLWAVPCFWIHDLANLINNAAIRSLENAKSGV